MRLNVPRKILEKGYKNARKVVVAVVGTTVVLFGIALLFLPGPAFVVIPAGLAILSLEFSFAKVWLQKVKRAGQSIRGGATTPVKNGPGEHPQQIKNRKRNRE
jgi:hypothetical protein